MGNWQRSTVSVVLQADYAPVSMAVVITLPASLLWNVLPADVIFVPVRKRLKSIYLSSR